jgi:hypothetical protein
MNKLIAVAVKKAAISRMMLIKNRDGAKQILKKNIRKRLRIFCGNTKKQYTLCNSHACFCWQPGIRGLSERGIECPLHEKIKKSF